MLLLWGVDRYLLGPRPLPGVVVDLSEVSRSVPAMTHLRQVSPAGLQGLHGVLNPGGRADGNISQDMHPRGVLSLVMDVEPRYAFQPVPRDGGAGSGGAQDLKVGRRWGWAVRGCVGV